MRENKRIREDEMNGTPTVDQESTYPNESASLSLKQDSTADILSHNQHVVINPSGTQNQQLVYQVQKLCDQDQNLVYFLVPTNENVQLPLPVSILPDQHAAEATICYSNENSQEQSPRDPLALDLEPPNPQSQPLRENNPNTSNNISQNKANTLKPIVYHCDFAECLEYFHSLYDKKLHLDTHIFPESTEFKCGLCNMKFSRAIDRNKHIESHAIAPTHKCKDCQQHFSYFTVLIKHLREKKCSTKTPITCYFCKTKLTDFDDLIRHHQMTMKQCACGAKKCGIHVFEMHAALCSKAKSVEPMLFERKRLKIDRGIKKATLMK